MTRVVQISFPGTENENEIEEDTVIYLYSKNTKRTKYIIVIEDLFSKIERSGKLVE